MELVQEARADERRALVPLPQRARIRDPAGVDLDLEHKKEEYDDIVTMGLPLDNAGKQIPAQLGTGGAFVPKGAKNVEGAKDFLKYLIQPKVTNEYLKTGLGRWLPAMPDLVKN